jgi:CelD/BcsL family acetyltransferase involved in cellulose biosynthesis
MAKVEYLLIEPRAERWIVRLDKRCERTHRSLRRMLERMGEVRTISEAEYKRRRTRHWFRSAEEAELFGEEWT